LALQELGDLRTLLIQVEPLVIWVHKSQKFHSNRFLAPEVMCKQNHGVAVDYYALGVIAYECMMGQV